ncbi:MAG: MBL fold metallo-hydrolase, partial [Oscillospiraceae bacterium]|nr:MBL fold metallo-hydrolase [Oscillospiraceae bacterium]
MKHSIMTKIMGVLLCICLLMGVFPLGTAHAAQKVEIVNATSELTEIARRAQAISDTLELLPATGSNRNGRVRLSGFTKSADGSKDMKDLKGKHYLIRNQDSVFYAVDGSWTGTDANLPLKVVTPSDTTSFYYITAGISTAMAFDFHYTGNASNGMPGYVLRFNNGRNLAVGTRYTGTYTNLYYVKADTNTDLSKAPKIRFDHPDGSGWARISNFAGTHGLRQSNDLTHVRWKDNSAGDNAYDGNALYLYRLWSTEGLRTAIENMKTYLDIPDLYEEAEYTQFLNCMEQSIALFRQYNERPTALIDPYDFIQDTLDRQAKTLKAIASKLVPVADLTPEQTAAVLRQEIDTLPTTGTNRNGRVLLSSFSQSADGSKDMKNLRGKHYLIRYQDPSFYAVDGSWTGTNGNLPLKQVNPSDSSSFLYIASGISTTMAFDFYYTGNASNGMPGYVLRFNNGRNLAVGTQYTGTYTNLYYVKADTTTTLSTAPKIRFEHPDGVNWVRIRNFAGTHGLRQSSDLTHVRWKDNSAGDNAYDGNTLYLYRLWSTNSIISAIHDMKSYLDTPGFYDPQTYGAFLACMEQAIDLFGKYNVVPKTAIQPYDFIQETLDQKAEELRAFAARLTDGIPKPSEATLNTTTKIHQLPSKQVRAEGDYQHNMSYIIQTREGKIIIIDGGWEQDNSDGKFLFSYLQKITGDPTPHIDAWFITHAHGDHHGAVSTFANLYVDQVTIDAYYHHNPTEAELSKYMPTESITGVNRVSMQMKKFRNKEGGAVKQIKVNSRHSGKCNSSFDFDEVHIDILLDFSDIIWAADHVTGTYSGTWPVDGRNFKNLTFKELVKGNFNETSIIFRVSVGGKNILFTGDAGYVAGYMLNKYHDAHASDPNNYYSIQSDYVQVAHHGYYGVTKATYQRINPDVGLWPTPKYEYTGSKSDLALPYALEWFAEMGVTNYPSYLGPQVFTFPVARKEAPITIPNDIRPYVFDAAYYRGKYDDLAQLYGDNEGQLYYHFIHYGIEEGRSASPFFDVKYYANQNSQHMTDTFRGDYVKAFEDFLKNYTTTNYLRLSQHFDPKVYAANHKELAAQGYTSVFSLLKHYAQNGYPMGEIATQDYPSADGRTYHKNCTFTQAVAPTCTEAGKTLGVQCDACGTVLEQQISVPAKGHTEAIDAGVSPTCTATGLTEGKHCSVCSAVLTAQEIVPANGHSYVYTRINALAHMVTCQNCDFSQEGAHTYTDGSCLCGE